MQQRDEARHPLVQQLGRALQCRGARLGRRPAPERKAGSRERRSNRGVFLRCVAHGGRWQRLAANGLQQVVQRHAVSEFDAARIDAWQIEFARQRQARIAGLIRRPDHLLRPFQQRGDGNAVVGSQRDERRVSAVLQKPPDQIGQQIAMAADRGVGAAGESRPVRMKLRVKRVAHAVQALKFETSITSCQFGDSRDRQRIVGGELRINAWT